MRYSLKFFTQGMTFLGVSSLLIFSTFRTAAISSPQKQPSFLQIQPSPFPSTVQPFLKPSILLEIKHLVQETENNNNPFIIKDASGRRGGKTVEELLKGSTFYSLLKLAQLQDILNPETQNLVIFAPTETAWAALGDQLKPLMQPENREQLRQLLRNHIVVSGISDEQFQQGSVQTLGGKTIQIQILNETETEVNGLRVLNDEDFIQAIDQQSIIIEIDQLLFESEI
jgi:uncharacterized surface protein with fasciclin (FAS1) repeats